MSDCSRRAYSGWGHFGLKTDVQRPLKPLSLKVKGKGTGFITLRNFFEASIPGIPLDFLCRNSYKGCSFGHHPTVKRIYTYASRKGKRQRSRYELQRSQCRRAQFLEALMKPPKGGVLVPLMQVPQSFSVPLKGSLKS
jgi:hypothetical protein